MLFVSALQKLKSVIIMHISPPFSVPFYPSRSSLQAKLASLCYLVTSHQLSLTLVGLSRKKGYFKKKKIYSHFIDYTKAFDCMDYSKLWEILKEMRVPDHLTCLMRNLCARQEATVKNEHGKWTGSKLGKEYVKTIYCHLAYLTYIQSTLRKKKKKKRAG